MALFGFGKKDKKEPKQPVRATQESESREVRPVARAVAVVEGSSNALLGPRITEKASFVAEKDGGYTFNVEANATKTMIADAVEKLYKVNVRKVSVAPIPSKNVFVRGKHGVKKGGHKAYVYLKKGEKIEIA